MLLKTIEGLHVDCSAALIALFLSYSVVWLAT